MNSRLVLRMEPTPGPLAEWFLSNGIGPVVGFFVVLLLAGIAGLVVHGLGGPDWVSGFAAGTVFGPLAILVGRWTSLGYLSDAYLNSTSLPPETS